MLAGGGFIGFNELANKSEGFRVGKVFKLSKKGVVFKTFEGQLNTESYSQEAAIFNFSVRRNQEQVLAEIEEAATKEYPVKLHYKQKFWKIAWWGDTDYFIVRVEKLNE